MVLRGDEAQAKAQFGTFRDSANPDAKSVHALRRTYYRLRSHFERTRWNSLVTWIMWNLVSVYLVTVLVSVQDRCIVCNKRTIGSEIIWDAPDGTQW